MTRSPRLFLGIALAALTILGGTDSAQAQRRNRSNSGGSNNNSNNNNDNSNNSGGNNSDNQRGGRRNRNRDNDGNTGTQQLQQIIQGGQGGQGNQNSAGNPQQQRRRGQQGGQRLNNGQDVHQILQGSHNDSHNHRGDNWQSRKHKHHHDLENWVVGFNGGPRPFTNNWYKNHPHAWHHHHHHDDDFWKVATAGAVIGWLGWQNHPHHHTTIVYDPVPVDTYVVDGQAGIAVDSNSPGEWLALGTFTLLTGADDPGTRILQLSVDKHGHVRGSYFDMITDATQNVFGVIDQNTQQVRWTLDTNRKLTFVATLDELTQPQGVVNVKLPGGQVQQWQLVRMEDAGN